jgi:uncharacterized protein YqjF (DUF2071 family)
MHWLITQRWEQVLFAHWRTDAEDVRRLLHAAVEPDVHDGSAWLGIVAFLMVGTRPSVGPRWRGLSAVPELNVRTYVRVDGIPGVWFLTLDTSSPLFVAIGRALFGLRYRLARMTTVVEGETVYYLSAAGPAAFSATYGPAGPLATAVAGSLEDALIERYRLFAQRGGRIVTAEVAHDPWQLQAVDAEIAVNRMVPLGLTCDSEPILHFARSTEARISAPRLCMVEPAPAARDLLHAPTRS